MAHIWGLCKMTMLFVKEHDLSLEVEADELFAALYMTIPVHLLAYRLSKEKGHDLEHSAYPDFDQITSSKI